jgi:hypothetical protein
VRVGNGDPVEDREPNADGQVSDEPLLLDAVHGWPEQAAVEEDVEGDGADFRGRLQVEAERRRLGGRGCVLVRDAVAGPELRQGYSDTG